MTKNLYAITIHVYIIIYDEEVDEYYLMKTFKYQ